MCIRDRNIPKPEQEKLTGESSMLGIQHWFFEQTCSEQSHYNQSVLLTIDKSVPEKHIDQSIKALVENHDALRFNYKQDPNFQNWIQTYGDQEAKLETVKIAEGEDIPTVIADTCKIAQKSLDIRHGELLKVVRLKTPETESRDRLLIVIHHLAIDGVSWRILLDQLSSALAALKKGEPIDLGLKTTSYRAWADSLKKVASLPLIENQLPFWQSTSQHYTPLPLSLSNNKFCKADETSITVNLAPQLTKALLHKANKAYSTQINDLLLSALVKTIGEWADFQNLVIGLEGHGREAISPEIDLSNTVGWFTSLFPVPFAYNNNMDLGTLIRSTKESLRVVPQKGLGYSILRYLHPSPNVRERLAKQKWDIVFNYLGQLDSLMNNFDGLDKASEESGPNIDDDFFFNHKLSLTSFISKGQLNITWSFSEDQYGKDTILQLTAVFLKHLEDLINHCVEQENQIYTPSDLGLEKDLSFEELDQVTNFVKNKPVGGQEILSF